jgi:hypothetical protein
MFLAFFYLGHKIPYHFLQGAFKPAVSGYELLLQLRRNVFPPGKYTIFAIPFDSTVAEVNSSARCDIDFGGRDLVVVP